MYCCVGVHVCFWIICNMFNWFTCASLGMNSPDRNLLEMQILHYVWKSIGIGLTNYNWYIVYPTHRYLPYFPTRSDSMRRTRRRERRREKAAIRPSLSSGVQAILFLVMNVLLTCTGIISIARERGRERFSECSAFVYGL